MIFPQHLPDAYFTSPLDSVEGSISLDGLEARVSLLESNNNNSPFPGDGGEGNTNSSITRSFRIGSSTLATLSYIRTGDLLTIIGKVEGLTSSSSGQTVISIGGLGRERYTFDPNKPVVASVSDIQEEGINFYPSGIFNSAYNFLARNTSGENKEGLTMSFTITGTYQDYVNNPSDPDSQEDF